MKAIVHVSPNSVYRHFNGHTFRVVKLDTSLTTIEYRGVEIQFTHDEVDIINIRDEYAKAVSCTEGAAIRAYANTRGINLNL